MTRRSLINLGATMGVNSLITTYLLSDSDPTLSQLESSLGMDCLVQEIFSISICNSASS